MNATRTVIAAARHTNSNGFRYTELDVVDAAEMIAEYTEQGYTCWIVGEVTIAAPAPTAADKARAKVAAARDARDAAASRKLVQEGMTGPFRDAAALAAARADAEKAEKAYHRAVKAADKVCGI
jgi:hypothetical protein